MNRPLAALGGKGSCEHFETQSLPPPFNQASRHVMRLMMMMMVAVVVIIVIVVMVLMTFQNMVKSHLTISESLQNKHFFYDFILNRGLGQESFLTLCQIVDSHVNIAFLVISTIFFLEKNCYIGLRENEQQK